MMRDALGCLAFGIVLLAGCEVHRTDDGQGDGRIGQAPDLPAVQKESESQEPQKTGVGTMTAEGTVPWENRRETAQPPLPDEDTEDHVREMFAELAAGKPEGVRRWLVPLEKLQSIQDMHMPSPEKNRRAVESLHAELTSRARNRAARFLKRNSMAQASFESLELGQCRFVPAGRDFNRLAFWSCEKNRIYYHVEGDRKALDVNRIINWGRTWYLWEW